MVAEGSNCPALVCPRPWSRPALALPAVKPLAIAFPTGITRSTTFLIGSDLRPPRLAGVVLYRQPLSGGRRGYEIYAHKLSTELTAELSQRPEEAEGR